MSDRIGYYISKTIVKFYYKVDIFYIDSLVQSLDLNFIKNF